MRQLRPLSDVTVQVLVIAGILGALVAVIRLVDPRFFQPLTLRSVGRDTAIYALIALGQAVVIIAGGIDLSVGSVLGFTGVAAMLLLNKAGVGFAVAAAAVLGLGLAIGLLHGVLICGLDLQPFLVTLCSLLVFRGLARVLTGDSVVAFDPVAHPVFAALGEAGWLGVPVPVYVLVSVLIPLGFFLHFTVPGRYLYAVGANIEAARFSGVPVNGLRVTAYAICAVLTTLAALLEAGSIGSVTPSTAGMAYEMYAITAAVLGGCALRGGKGSLVGVVLGAAVLRVLRSAVIFLEISTYWTLAVTGLVLLGAVIVDAVVRRRRP